MKRLIYLWIPVLAVGVLLPDMAWAQTYQLPSGVRAGREITYEFHGYGRASFTTLKVGQSARAAGMGDAYTAVADDINAMFWNAAGLTQIRSPSVSTILVELTRLATIPISTMSRVR